MTALQSSYNQMCNLEIEVIAKGIFDDYSNVTLDCLLWSFKDCFCFYVI